jgi:hypothetical protein
MKYLCLTVVLVVVFFCISASQSSRQLGILPSLNVNKKLPKDWSVNFKAEARQTLIQDDYEYNDGRTELSFIAAKKISINARVAAGYLMKIESESTSNRAIQQLSWIRRYPGFTLSHRFSADQTIEKDEPIIFRFRYRIASEIPLAGQTVDPGELFLKISNEYLNGFLDIYYDLEIRSAAFAGYLLTPKNKIELGVDYRISSFIDNLPRHNFWIGLNFYQSI